jgi:hypothetical protein
MLVLRVVFYILMLVLFFAFPRGSVPRNNQMLWRMPCCGAAVKIIAQNAVPMPQNAVPMPQNAVPMPQNAVPMPQNAVPMPQNAVTMPQNAATRPEKCRDNTA